MLTCDKCGLTFTFPTCNDCLKRGHVRHAYITDNCNNSHLGNDTGISHHPCQNCPPVLIDSSIIFTTNHCLILLGIVLFVGVTSQMK